VKQSTIIAAVVFVLVLVAALLYASGIFRVEQNLSSGPGESFIVP
jgi:uncharacterized protein YraI